MHKTVYAYNCSILYLFQTILPSEGFMNGISPSVFWVWPASQSLALESPECLFNMQILDPTEKRLESLV